MEEITQPINGTEKKPGKVIVPIRVHPTMKGDDGEPLSTMSLMKILANNRKPDGMTTSDMRSLWKALDKAEAVHADTTVLELELNEAKIMLDLSKNFKYIIADRFFTDFEDSLL